MILRIQIGSALGQPDPREAHLLAEIAQLGIESVAGVRISTLYFLDVADGPFDPAKVVNALLVDPVSECAEWSELPAPPRPALPGRATVEVMLRAGVADSVAESLLQGAAMLGVTAIQRAARGDRYELMGELTGDEVGLIARKVLANEVIHSFAVNEPVRPPFFAFQAVDPTVTTVSLRNADDDRLLAVSGERRLALDRTEMQAIRTHFAECGREPTDVELEMLAQTWSEHCSHKSLHGLVDYRESDCDGQDLPGRRTSIDSLLRSHIVEATRKAGREWVRSAFVDNAGIVAFDDDYDLAFKVETHNHPSALEPFGGANTGTGGVIRDVMGVGARPIAATDVLCFGPLDLPASEVPTGAHHPRRIAAGVVAGIADYGNKMGVPTVGGAVLYHPGYTANPLVYCGCLGILPRNAYRRAAAASDWVVVLGGRTGRDGLRGATFSSMGMTCQTSHLAGSAVQIGAPIEQKKLCDALVVARDEQLYTAVTDCGAGGLSSAVGELAAELGAEVELDRVPLKYPGLRPWEIWLSEAQERMVLAVAPDQLERLRAVCDAAGVEATAIGRLTGDGVIRVRFAGTLVCELPTSLLFANQPRKRLAAHWQPPRIEEPATPAPEDLTADLLALLATGEIRSKEEIVRRYDHEVGAGTRHRPLCGARDDGPSDGAVLVPLETVHPTGPPPRRAIALAVGLCPSYGVFDPYAMGWAAVDEAMRNAVAVGADPERIALLDNLCWGSPERPALLGALVQCVRGMCDAATAFGAPFISGKDSLNNEYRDGDGVATAIPGTLLVSALGIVPDVHQVPGSDLKTAGDRIYVIGTTADELGGSAFLRRRGLESARVPRPVPHARALLGALHRATRGGMVRACHDCSEGGLAVACAEMALGGGLGMIIELDRVPVRDEPLAPAALSFSESLTRCVVCVSPDRAAELEAFLSQAQVPHAHVGSVCAAETFILRATNDRPVIHTTVGRLRDAWRGHVEAMVPPEHRGRVAAGRGDGNPTGERP